MEQSISTVLRQIPKPKVQNLVKEVFNTHYDKFIKEPAGCGNHHAYDGGLFVHSVSTAGMAAKICDHYSDIDLDKSICVAGAFLHDVGKVRCYYKDKNNGKYKSTKASMWFHHIPIGFHLVASQYEKMKEDERPSQDDLDHILHIIISHHGKKQYSSPRRPKTDEARIAAEADFIDAYLNAGPNYKGIYGK
jgi:3'-5' exoribonuclease